MRLVDTVVCVGCGTREFTPARGKSARVQNGMCSACGSNWGEEFKNASKTDGTTEQQTSIPEGKPRK